jgi:hypothetical protein
MAWSSAAGAAIARPDRGMPRPSRGEQATAMIAALSLGLAAWPVLMSSPDEAGSEAHRPGNPADVAARSETLIAGYGGMTHTQSSDVRFSKPGVTDLTAHDVDWIGRPFKSPIYYGLRAMRWPAASRIGSMVDFTHAKAISVREQQVRFTGTRNGRPADQSASIGDTFRHLEFSHGHNMLTLNALLSLGHLTPALRPYVGLGVGVSLPHTEVQFNDEAKRTYEYQITGAVGQVVAGVEIRLPRVSVLLEYKFSAAPYWVPLSGLDGTKNNAFLDYWGQIRRWWQGEAPEFGTLATNLFTHHFIVGAGYRHARASVAP